MSNHATFYMVFIRAANISKVTFVALSVYLCNIKAPEIRDHSMEIIREVMWTEHVLNHELASSELFMKP